MKVVSYSQVDTLEYGYDPHSFVYSILLEVQAANAQTEAYEILKSLTDLSWVNKFDVIDRQSYLACAEPTINKIVESILKKVGNTVEKEFGEYLVSYSAQRALVDTLAHRPLPLAELIKEKVSGNPGFDFHTVSPQEFIVFGEAKYASSGSAYDEAQPQIVDFLKAENNKHLKELKELRRFAGDTPAQNVIENKFGVAAAFSIRAQKPKLILNNAIKRPEFKDLLVNKEVYVIGVHIV